LIGGLFEAGGEPEQEEDGALPWQSGDDKGAAEASVELEHVASDELLGVVADDTGAGRWRSGGGEGAAEACVELERVTYGELLGVVTDGGAAVTARELWRPLSSLSTSPPASSLALLRKAAVQRAADIGGATTVMFRPPSSSWASLRTAAVQARRRAEVPARVSRARADRGDQEIPAELLRMASGSDPAEGLFDCSHPGRDPASIPV
jgi:hypothetical protein